MSTQKRFRFGVQSFSASSRKEWCDRARRAEDLGYAVLSLADHFIGPGPAQEATLHPPQELATVPAMAVAAEATETLRIACRVFCNDYRHPVMLAKDAATLDMLSEGRMEIGVGAGWLAGEYAAAGIPFDPPGLRISRLAETITLMKQLMAEGQVDFQGEHYQVSGFEGKPKPVQQPHPPLMVGGGGRRVLSLAAREADIVSLNFNNRSGVLGPDGVQTSTADQTLEKIGWIRQAAGDRFEALEIEIGAYFTFVTDQAKETAAGMGGLFGLTGDEMCAHPHALIGSPASIIEELLARRDRYGFSYVTVGDAQMEDFAPVVAELAGK
jgi:probable F420-dependent oxidoreductase